ncbi:MAG: type 1 glutamine amidotransferase [Chloroflexi bacterium]|nr:type 1 glutamine amidotransferase [Chloroflexota bacterium]
MDLKGLRVAYLVETEFEDLEFWVPRMRLEEEGAQITVISTKPGEYKGKHGLTAKAEMAASQVNADQFDALVIPGGWCPDKLRRDKGVLDLVRGMDSQRKTIAVICHGGWVPASAGILKGRKVTGSRGIRDDMINAGAEWVDAAAFCEGHMVWGRVVDDIPDFCRELVATLKEKRDTTAR